MNRVHRICEIIIKASFSAVILQLLLISLFAEAGRFSPSFVTAMLEYPAAACMCALGGGLFMEYILKNEEN